VLVLAHFGHWYASIVFAAPFLLLVGLLTVGRLVERRRERRGRQDGTSSTPTS
jgi:hypothetical protein